MKLILDGKESYTHEVSFPKEVFQQYIWKYYSLYLNDEHNGNNDGLFKFKMSYNRFHKLYDISIIGGTRFTIKTNELIKILKEEGYKVGNPEYTFCWDNERKHNGLRFFVYAKE